jgi:ribosomal protein S18 acetylase RimI-like enzyme
MYLDEICFPEEDPYVGEDVLHWVIWDVDKPVAYCSLRSTGYGEIFMARSGVLPKYRGMGLHRRMIKHRIRYARRKSFKKIYTYAEHSNPASINNLMRCGFQYYNPDYAFAGKEFLYFCRDL